PLPGVLYRRTPGPLLDKARPTGPGASVEVMMSRPRDVFTAEARGLGREAYITAAGLATSLGTVAVVWLGIALFGVDLSSLSVWIVVPVGAVAAGAVAASGYYIGAVRTETKPSLQLLVNMVLI